MNKKINWVEGDGGPHIIIESKFLKIWKGEFPACDFDKGWHYNYCKFNLLPGNYRVKMIEEYVIKDSSFRLFKFIKTS